MPNPNYVGTLKGSSNRKERRAGANLQKALGSRSEYFGDFLDYLGENNKLNDYIGAWGASKEGRLSSDYAKFAREKNIGGNYYNSKDLQDVFRKLGKTHNNDLQSWWNGLGRRAQTGSTNVGSSPVNTQPQPQPQNPATGGGSRTNPIYTMPEEDEEPINGGVLHEALIHAEGHPYAEMRDTDWNDNSYVDTGIGTYGNNATISDLAGATRRQRKNIRMGNTTMLDNGSVYNPNGGAQTRRDLRNARKLRRANSSRRGGNLVMRNYLEGFNSGGKLIKKKW